MLNERDLREVLEVALSHGGDFAEIFIEKKRNTGISLEADRIERIVSGVDVGAGIRVLVGENTSYAYTNDISKEGLKKVAAIVAKAGKESKKDVTINLKQIKYTTDLDIVKMPDSVSIDDKVELVKRANAAARKFDKRIVQVTAGYGDAVQEVIIVNSLGELVQDTRIRSRLLINSVASAGDVIQTGYEAVGGFAGFELFDNNVPEEMAEKAARRAVLMLEAKPAPAGKMPVVMAAEAGGTMVHEACGHGLEADLVQKNLSVYAGKIGQKVASDIVTVIDDATLKNKYGFLAIDDEGVPGQKTVLIENGILKDYMYDRLAAMKENRESTGNGRRESYQDRPIPRMTNTYIAPGKSDPKDIIRSTERGLFVKKMGGGQVNTTTGEFVFDVAEGYLIKDGEIKEPVRGATLTGNGPEVLQKIDMVGNDLGFAIGTCGKDGQGAPVSDAQPTIRIPELIVGGILND